MSALLDHLRSDLPGILGSRPFERRELTFFLGTDEHIPHETRVALSPAQLAALQGDLAQCGLTVRLLVHTGAGERAGYPDAEYAEVGAEIVDPHNLHDLGRVDVFHALKEPTWYESQIPGPFLRIGALHLASYPPGVCSLLSSRHFAGILDGGTIGDCAWVRHGGDRTPIVGSMSRFAGRVAAVKALEGIARHGIGPGKLIVVGGGIAGTSAIKVLRPQVEKLVVVESWAPARERLPGVLADLGYAAAEIEIVERLDDVVMTDAIGIVFAHRSGAKAAEKVCNDAQIRLMKKGAAISDIAIDQGGSILHDGYSEYDDAATSRAKYQDLLVDYSYFAETNMPREMPNEASPAHGEASLPYVEALLALTAMHGDSREAAREILEHPKQSFDANADLGDRTFLDCLIQDLRNGLQIANVDRVEITDPDIVKHQALVDWVKTCAHTNGG